ncbi:MAG TPA: transcriptional regulator [Gammaproteobacteria bacterium]|nr:transcriptional regulator [Gammaproteobacteria bacterium]
MVEYNENDSGDRNLRDNAALSELFKAVSDTTRRALLTQICQQGPSRVTDLANDYEMSLNAISKHIKVLEKAQLVTRTNIGRTHWIEADLGRVNKIENWFKALKSIWELRLNKLDELIGTGDKEDD